MLQSATPRTSPAAAGAGLLADRGDEESRLRRAVVAGPGGPVEVDDVVLGGVLGSLAEEAVIRAGLSAAGHVDQRSRVLTGVVVVAAALGLCLFRRENYDLVLARVLAGSRRRVIDGGPPTGQALSTARARLAPGSMRAVFEQAAAVMPAAGPGGYAFGLLLTAFDGTVFDLGATAEIAAQFATPSGGRFPQARLVTLIACGTRWIIAARPGSAGLSEQHLVDQLLGTLLPGTLNLADRNFFSMARWTRCAATGAHLGWRVKNGAKSLPARIVRVLPDGSAVVRLHESDAMLTDRRLPRLADILARLVEFTLTVTDSTGRARTTRFQILTTLLDHETYPAAQVAAVYAQRWQVEVIYLRVKATLRGSGTRLRGQTPDLADQEIWGLLTVYNALAGLAAAAAVVLDVDPDEISFAAVLALTRSSATTDPGCVQCGHRPDNPIDDLITAIAAQPRNRTTRQRTSPRTKAQRQTQTNPRRQLHDHHRDVKSTQRSMNRVVLRAVAPGRDPRMDYAIRLLALAALTRPPSRAAEAWAVRHLAQLRAVREPRLSLDEDGEIWLVLMDLEQGRRYGLLWTSVPESDRRHGCRQRLCASRPRRYAAARAFVRAGIPWVQRLHLAAQRRRWRTLAPGPGHDRR